MPRPSKYPEELLARRVRLVLESGRLIAMSIVVDFPLDVAKAVQAPCDSRLRRSVR